MEASVLTTVCDGSQPNNKAWKLFEISGCNSDTAALNNKMKHPTADGDINFFEMFHISLNVSGTKF